jgi:peptidoglycan hydrolase-like protein with peptidoglycan-binding domain
MFLRSRQARLKALHYDVGPVNGWSGADTSHAVTAFQKVQGIPPTSVVDDLTWEALAHPRRPTVRHRSSGTAIEVNLAPQVVTILRHSPRQALPSTALMSCRRNRQSHGCVRVTVPAMRRLFPQLTLGMPVWVY